MILVVLAVIGGIAVIAVLAMWMMMAFGMGGSMGMMEGAGMMYCCRYIGILYSLVFVGLAAAVILLISRK